MTSVAWEDRHDLLEDGGRTRRLSRAQTQHAPRLDVDVIELPPGRSSGAAHFHLASEEHIFVLEGTATLRVGHRDYAMRVGDYVVLAEDIREGFNLINTGDVPCVYVNVAEASPRDALVFPDRSRPQGVVGTSSLQTGSGGRIGLLSSDAMIWDEEGSGSEIVGSSNHMTLAALGETYRVGMLLEAPAPGKRLGRHHYHKHEEEHALILEGDLTLHLGDERFRMRPGDYVCFPPGREVAHAFQNSGTGPCRYLMIGERIPGDVRVYP